MRPFIGIRRDHRQRYLASMVVAFTVTVVAVRVYLDATGYPKVGGGGLHVAHMLWGGLLLLVAALVGLSFVGRRALALSAVAAGVGVGLFIDEVGKFITESNDYFYAPAAPIIYGAILLLLLLWVVVRHDDRPTATEAVHGALEAVRDLIDGRLDPSDRDRALHRLGVAGADQPLGDISVALFAILASPASEARLTSSDVSGRGRALTWLRRLLPARLELWIIRIGLLLSALTALLGVLVAIALLNGATGAIVTAQTGPIEYPDEPLWVLLLAGVWMVVGVANGAALVLSLTGRDRVAMAIAQYSILTALVAGGLLNVYVSQLGALSDILALLVLLALVLDRRARDAQSDDQSGSRVQVPRA